MYVAVSYMYVSLTAVDETLVYVQNEHRRNLLLECIVGAMYCSGMTIPSQKCAYPPYPCSFHMYVGDVE